MKRNLGVSVEDFYIRQIDLLVGPGERSQFFQEAAVEKLARMRERLPEVLQGAQVEHAVRQPAADDVPPLLRDAVVQHAHSKHPSGIIFANASMIHPARKAVEDTADPGRGASFSIRHDLRGDQLPASSVVRQGRHRLQPAKCDGCVLVLRDAPDWA